MQRNGHKDVISFIPGKSEMPRYKDGNGYLASKILWCSNLKTCIRKVIPGFNIYALHYFVSWLQWREMKEIADKHGFYARKVAEEIDSWLHYVSDSGDPAMTIMCI